MAYILSIETSTQVCSVAIASDGLVIDSRESFDDKTHASLLTVFIDELLKSNKLQVKDLQAVSVSQGPGSYTGLRIGVSVAKGLCYAAGLPLIAVNTLKAMALMAKESMSDSSVLLCPMIDARRMEVYSELFDYNLIEKRGIIAEVIDSNSYLEALAKQQVAFFGNGAAKCSELFLNRNAQFIDNIYPSAKYMAALAHQAFTHQEFVDVAYFEPFYLKDFVATIPKRRMF
jgi:tRNA threonylcarbamoyladenosine biosynthesis protein TsaB